MSSFLASGVRRVFAHVFPQQTRGASVLMYHSVGDNKAFFTVSPQQFEAQLQDLLARGKEIVPLATLLMRQRTGESLANVVALTFDDGYEDTLTQALPILRKYGLRAAIFLIPSQIGKAYTTSDGVTLPLFSWEQFVALGGADVFDCLSHTLHHPELPTLDKNAASEEIELGRNMLATLSGWEIPKILAYPRGKYNLETVSCLQDLGWDAALTVRPGLVLANTPVFTLPRNPIDSRTSLAQVRFYTSNAVYWYQRLWSAIF